MSFLQSSFARALQKSRLVNAFVRHAGKITSGLGLFCAPLVAANRSFTSGHLTMDTMTLSGLAMIASVAAMAPADDHPVFKRISGGLGLLSIGLLLYDAYGKTGAAGLALSNSLVAMICLSMMFEREKMPEAKVLGESRSPLGQTWDRAVSGFKEAPIFWTSMAAVALKPLSMLYGLANHETLFLAAAVLAMVENATNGLTDNKVKRFFGIADESKKSIPSATPQ